MKDTVAEVVAGHVAGLITQLQAMGLRKPSIIAGLQLGLDRAKSPAPERPTD